MIKKHTLLRSQKKETFAILREIGLEPADFEWSQAMTDEETAVSRLNYRQGDYYFQFSSYQMGAYCIACPGLGHLIACDHPRDWDEQRNHFCNWAEHLRREIQCVDPWDELAKYRIASAAVGGADGPNETISGTEAREIAQNLTALAAAIKAEFDLAEEQAAFVRERLAYLGEAAMREKSRDWVYSTLGVCATLAMALALDADGAAKLWSLLKQQLGAFIRLTDH